MGEMKLGVVEAQFADIIWENEPLPSGELVKLCAEKLEWKKIIHDLWECKMQSHCGRNSVVLQKVKELQYDPAISITRYIPTEN